MKICFHVDDCKLVHKSSRQMDRMIDYHRKEYESIFEDGSGKMTVKRGKVYEYLGMRIDYSEPGKAKVRMLNYVEEILTAFAKADPKATGTKSSAAPENLFVVNEECEKLSTDKSVHFHNLVAKTLYTTKRARPDTCTAVAFLTTRVQEPNLDDWNKLSHMMRYIRGTRQLPLMYRIMCDSLFQSSKSGSRTLVVKNATAVQVSSRALLVAYNVFATKL